MTFVAWSAWPRALGPRRGSSTAPPPRPRGERRSRQLEVMRQLHGDRDDGNVGAVHEALGDIERERHSEAPAGGISVFAPAGGQRRALEVIRERLQGRDVRLRHPAAIRMSADDADANSLGHDALLNM